MAIVLESGWMEVKSPAVPILAAAPAFLPGLVEEVEIVEVGVPSMGLMAGDHLLCHKDVIFSFREGSTVRLYTTSELAIAVVT